MRLGIENEESSSPLANPLHEPAVIGAIQQRFDAVKWVGAAAGGARRSFGRFSPLINHRKRQPQLRGHLLGAALLEDFAQKLM